MAEKNIKRTAARKKPPVKDAAKKRENTTTVKNNKLFMLVTVVSRNKAEYYADLIQSFEVNLQTVALANGTADAKTMRYLGLTDTEKVVIFSIIQQNRLPDATHALDEKFKTVKGGKGIAFTVPLTSVMGKLLFGFLSNNRTVVQEEK